MGIEFVIATDIEKPEENSSINILRDIAKEKGIILRDETIKFPTQKMVSLSKNYVREKGFEEIYESLKYVPWSPEKLKDYATHPAIKQAIDDISMGKDKNHSLVEAYQRISEEEDRIHTAVYSNVVADVARQRLKNEEINILTLPLNTRNLSDRLIARGGFSYHLVGRGFYSLGYTSPLFVEDKSLKKGIAKKGSIIYIQLSFPESLSSEEDKERYLKHIFGHEYEGHFKRDLPDHYTERNCVMDTYPNPEGYLKFARKLNGELRFCESCRSRKR